MCNADKHHKVCTVGLCATERCVLVHFVMGSFGVVGLLWHCWEGSIVDRLPVVGYFLGCGASYFKIVLVDCWG